MDTFSNLGGILQARSVSRRSMPGQAEEEVNQLTYVQKHLPNLLSLLAETTEEEESSGKVIKVNLMWRKLSFHLQHQLHELLGLLLLSSLMYLSPV